MYYQYTFPTMAPKKKSNQHNAFFFYISDIMAHHKHWSSMSYNDLVEAAELSWEALPVKERAKYEAKAIEWKISEQKNLEHKYTTTGVSYAELERREREQLEKEQEMNKEIESTISLLDGDMALAAKSFFFIHVNFHCHTDIGTFIPCEVAISEFTLQDGVKNYYHTIINIEEVPLGYSYEALKVSEETHQIPIPPHDLGEKNFYIMLRMIKSFLEKSRTGRVLPPLYTQTSGLPVVKSFIKILTANANEPEDLFRIYPLPKLFFELRNACANYFVFPVLSVAERELDKDHFSFTPGLSCNYHENTDARQYCSLSLVKRWAYTISDHCCQDLEIDLVPGHHVPLFADTLHYLKVKTNRDQSPSEDQFSQELQDCTLSASAMPGMLQHGPSNQNEEYKPLRPPRCPYKLENQKLKPLFETKSSPKLEEEMYKDLQSSSKEVNELKPLRLPKSSGIAMRGMPPNFKPNLFVNMEEDDNEPLAVAGRGRGIRSRCPNPQKGRGRGILKGL